MLLRTKIHEKNPIFEPLGGCQSWQQWKKFVTLWYPTVRWGLESKLGFIPDYSFIHSFIQSLWSGLKNKNKNLGLIAICSKKQKYSLSKVYSPSTKDGCTKCELEWWTPKTTQRAFLVIWYSNIITFHYIFIYIEAHLLYSVCGVAIPRCGSDEPPEKSKRTF